MKPLHGISKEGLGARVGRSKVWALGAERIRVAGKGYTFGDENVYVSSVKRIRLGHETYTFCPDKVYVSLILIASRMLKAILLPRRNPEHH